ncbi:unnamed protein product [Heterobilharzia americana]|nr:unnamed protein product [Heterobilharzia americana]
MQQNNTHSGGNQSTGGMRPVNPVSPLMGVENDAKVNSLHVDDVGVVNSLNMRCSASVSGTIDLSISISSDEESVPSMCANRDDLCADDVNERIANANGHHVCDRKRRSSSEILATKLLKYLDMKIDIVEMKKRYWCEKLNAMSKS